MLPELQKYLSLGSASGHHIMFWPVFVCSFSWLWRLLVLKEAEEAKLWDQCAVGLTLLIGLVHVALGPGVPSCISWELHNSQPRKPKQMKSLKSVHTTFFLITCFQFSESFSAKIKPRKVFRCPLAHCWGEGWYLRKKGCCLCKVIKKTKKTREGRKCRVRK